MPELYIPKPIIPNLLRQKAVMEQGGREQQRINLLREQGQRSQQGLDLNREQFEQKKKQDTLTKRIKFINILKDIDENAAMDMFFKTLKEFPSPESEGLDEDKIRDNKGKFLKDFTSIFTDFNNPQSPAYKDGNKVKMGLTLLYAKYPKRKEVIERGIKTVAPETEKLTPFQDWRKRNPEAPVKEFFEAKRAPEKAEVTEPKARKRLTDLETSKVKLQAGKGLDRIERALLAQFAPEVLGQIDKGDITAALAQIDDEIAYYKDFLGEETPEEVVPEEEITPTTRFDYTPGGGFTEVK